ncbi:hypothetical protein RFI_12669, partial [Reticulomyxa filosa]
MIIYIPEKTTYWFGKYYAKQLNLSVQQWAIVLAVGSVGTNVLFLIYTLLLKLPSNILQFSCLMLCSLSIGLFAVPLFQTVWMLGILRILYLTGDIIVGSNMYAIVSKANKQESGRMVGVLGSSWPLVTILFVPCAYTLKNFGAVAIFLFCSVCLGLFGFLLFQLYPSLQEEMCLEGIWTTHDESKESDDKDKSEKHEYADETQTDTTFFTQTIVSPFRSFADISWRNDWALAQTLLRDCNCLLLYVTTCLPRAVPIIVQVVLPMWLSETFSFSIANIGWVAL